jgi:hypothetical protein
MNKNKAFAWLVMGLIVVVLWMWIGIGVDSSGVAEFSRISEDELMAPYIERYGEQFEYRHPETGVRIYWWEDAQVYVQIEYRDRDNAVDGEYGWFVKKELL